MVTRLYPLYQEIPLLQDTLLRESTVVTFWCSSREGKKLISALKGINFVILGPDLPITLLYHSMVPIGLGQAIIGGAQTVIHNTAKYHQKNIFFVTCSNRNCIVTTLSKELSNPLSLFAAIPIPDSTARCISRGKMFNLILAL